MTLGGRYRADGTVARIFHSTESVNVLDSAIITLLLLRFLGRPLGPYYLSLVVFSTYLGIVGHVVRCGRLRRLLSHL